MVQKLNKLAIGYSAAIISATFILLLGIAGNIGVYEEAAFQMMELHIFFNLSPLGILAGMAEEGAWSFIAGYLFAFLYNKFA